MSEDQSKANVGHTPQRRRLGTERAALNHKFSIGGHEGYITIGLYPDGAPAECFIRMNKEGSTLSGIMDTLAISWSLALQYGVPLRALVDKLKDLRFEPSGYTGNEDVPHAHSISDYIGRWLELKFLPKADADRFAAGRPVAEHDPKPRPESDSDDINVLPPIDDPVLSQVANINSGLTTPMDPTRKEP